jgi:hypothetical protein
MQLRAYALVVANGESGQKWREAHWGSVYTLRYAKHV